MELGKIIKTGADSNKINAISLAAKMQGFLSETINLKKGVEELTDDELIAMIQGNNE